MRLTCGNSVTADPGTGISTPHTLRRRQRTELRIWPLTCENRSSWSYGDSNSGPLACHQQAARPPECIAAGHRPEQCMPVRSGPHRLLYFPAVLPRASASVHACCSTFLLYTTDAACGDPAGQPAEIAVPQRILPICRERAPRIARFRSEAGRAACLGRTGRPVAVTASRQGLPAVPRAVDLPGGTFRFNAAGSW